MENLVCGSEALAVFGISHKRGPVASMLRRFGLEPVYQKNIGRGLTVFYRKEDVDAAREKHRDKLQEKEKKAEEFVKLGEQSRFVPTRAMFDIQKSMEEKLDKILNILQKFVS